MTDLTDKAAALRAIDPGDGDFHLGDWTAIAALPSATDADAIRAAEDRGIQIGLRAAAEAVETQGDSTATDALSVRLCCNGHMCGCRGATVEEWLTYIIRAITPAEARKIGDPK